MLKLSRELSSGCWWAGGGCGGDAGDDADTAVLAGFRRSSGAGRDSSSLAWFSTMRWMEARMLRLASGSGAGRGGAVALGGGDAGDAGRNTSAIMNELRLRPSWDSCESWESWDSCASWVVCGCGGSELTERWSVSPSQEPSPPEPCRPVPPLPASASTSSELSELPTSPRSVAGDAARASADALSHSAFIAALSQSRSPALALAQTLMIRAGFQAAVQAGFRRHRHRRPRVRARATFLCATLLPLLYQAFVAWTGYTAIATNSSIISAGARI